MPSAFQRKRRKVSGEHLWKPGQSGNPKGRPPGIPDARSQSAKAILAKLDFEPLEQQIRLAKQLQHKLQRNHFADTGEKIAYLQIYAGVLKDITRYIHPQLKAVDHFIFAEVLHKLDHLETVPDAELDALIAEAEELLHAVPTA